MTKEELRAGMETELAWRQEELAFFKNQLTNIDDELKKDKYRKSLVLMLYSHFEGFIKICLLSYVQYINSLKLERYKFNEKLIASSMESEFNAYDNSAQKCKIFKGKVLDDSRLHKFHRRVNLLYGMENMKQGVLNIPDQTIDTESNLWYIVLQKNLYKVGLSINLFDDLSNDIDALVNRRNSIAHGSERAGVKESEYSKWEEKAYKIMEHITKYIYKDVCQKNYLKEIVKENKL